jgi:hypothetical protein
VTLAELYIDRARLTLLARALGVRHAQAKARERPREAAQPGHVEAASHPVEAAASRPVKGYPEFREDQPRDEGGRWAETGGGGVTAESQGSPSDPWGSATHERLVGEHEPVRQQMEQWAQEIAAGTAEIAPVAVAPTAWDELTEEQHTAAEESWIDNNLSEWVNSEVESQVDYGAASALAGDEEFWKEAVNEFLGEQDTDLDKDSLLQALHVEQDEEDVKVEVDPTKLRWGRDDPSQGELDLNDPRDPQGRWNALKADWEDFLKQRTEQGLIGKRDEFFSNPPEWLQESAKESMADYWDNFDDDEKFDQAKSALDLSVEKPSEAPVGLPTRWKPFEDGADYERTRATAHFLAEKRFTQLLTERNIPAASFRSYGALSERYWGAWKSDSQSPEGRLLQAAAAEEFGTRTRIKGEAFNPSDMKTARAYVRAARHHRAVCRCRAQRAGIPHDVPPPARQARPTKGQRGVPAVRVSGSASHSAADARCSHRLDAGRLQYETAGKPGCPAPSAGRTE